MTLALSIPPLSAPAPGWTLLFTRLSPSGSIIRCWKHDATGETFLSGITYVTYPNLAYRPEETE